MKCRLRWLSTGPGAWECKSGEVIGCVLSEGNRNRLLEHGGKVMTCHLSAKGLAYRAVRVEVSAQDIRHIFAAVEVVVGEL